MPEPISACFCGPKQYDNDKSINHNYRHRAQETKLFGCDDENQIVMNGYICKQPSYRMTPLGREICDVMLAVNRGNGKSDYIPCIVWGRNAKYMADRKVGEQFCISGRIQSREYTKMTEEMSEIRIAYEVSVQKIEAGKEVTETEEDFEL